MDSVPSTLKEEGEGEGGREGGRERGEERKGGVERRGREMGEGEGRGEEGRRGEKRKEDGRGREEYSLLKTSHGHHIHTKILHIGHNTYQITAVNSPLTGSTNNIGHGQLDKHGCQINVYQIKQDTLGKGVPYSPSCKR